MSHAARTRLHGFTTTLRRPGFGHTVARTAGFNSPPPAAAGVGGIILARSAGHQADADRPGPPGWT